MTNIEAMKQALEALESLNDVQQIDKATNALRQAIAEAEKQEPLEYWNAVEGWVKLDEVREHFDSVNCGTIYKNGGEGRVPLYTHPAQPKAEQEPKREPLTDEQIAAMWSQYNPLHGIASFARAIEAAHGIGDKA